MLNILAFLKSLGLILRAFFKNWIQIIIGAIVLISIFEFVDTVWLKWFLAVMTGGAFFYSIYDDMALFIQNEAFKSVEKLSPEAKERVIRKYKKKYKKSPYE